MRRWAVLIPVLMLCMPVVASANCSGADAMPDESGHNHEDATQHDFACGIRELAYRDLEDLVQEPAEFGEADIAGHLVAMAVAYPEAGFVLFDVSNPRNPKTLSRFRSEPCERIVLDYDCGADVKLSDDGALAFLALQKTSLPQGEPPGTPVLPKRAGIVVVDVSNPRAPREIGFTPIALRGTHLLAYKRIKSVEYVYPIHNGVGFSIYRLTRPATLRLVADVTTKGAHDVSVYEDPADGKTYAYLAGALAGLLVYDVTTPAKPVQAGSWLPPSQRTGETWYVHGAWTFRVGAKRFTLVAPELSQPGKDHASLPSPVWLLDTTDHAHPALIGEWHNPSNRAAGALGFSAHNFWLDGQRTWLAHYHGGVWLLDWSDVIAGASRTPSVVGYYLPHGSTRPFVRVTPHRRFLSAFDTFRRPMVWDVVSDGKNAYVSDITGGFSVITQGEPDASSEASRSYLPFAVAAAGLAVIAAGWLVLRRRVDRSSAGP